MKILTINYLSHGRPEYFSLSKNILKNISDENKSKIHLNILYSRDFDWESEIEGLGISTSLYKIDENRYDNYLYKIKIATEASTKYSCKLDEDCFISEHTWDYIINNLDILEDEKNIVLSPIISNNIPFCDLFMEQFLDKNVFENVCNLFLKQRMPNGLWGVDYSSLDRFTIFSDKWDCELFYKAVLELDTDTKGIHPLRINYEAQVLINDFIISNPEKIFNRQNYSISFLSRPYFTNSFFFIKTETWKNIINSVIYDAYDEITLNKQMRDSNKKIAYINNGFCSHMMFNTVYGNKNKWNIGGEDGWTYEKEFYIQLKDKYDMLHLV
jgi:hypothetical protein